MQVSRSLQQELLRCWSPYRSAAANAASGFYCRRFAKLYAGSDSAAIPVQDEAPVCCELVTTTVRLPTAEQLATIRADALLPVYDMMHAAGSGLVPPVGTASHVENLSWGPSGWASALEQLLDSSIAAEQAGAALGCGGLLAGLAASRVHTQPRHALMHRMQQRLEHVCGEVSGSGRLLGGARLVLGATALATWLSQQACGLPPPSPASWRCQLHGLLEGLLSLDGLYEAAHKSVLPREASAALDARLQGRALQLAGPMSACA